METKATHSGRMSAAAAAVFLLGVSALAVVTVRSSNAPRTAAAPATVDESHALIAEQQRVLASLQSRVFELEKRLAARAEPARTPAPVGVDSIGPATDEMRELDEHRVAEYESKLDRLGNSERVDEAWNTDVHGSVQQRLAALTDPPALDSVRCGTTLCAIQITHRDPDAHTRLFDALTNPNDMARGFGGRSLVRRHAQPDGAFRSMIYLARFDGTLPDMDEQ